MAEGRVVLRRVLVATAKAECGAANRVSGDARHTMGRAREGQVGTRNPTLLIWVSGPCVQYFTK